MDMNDLELVRRILEYDNMSAIVSNNDEHMVLALSNTKDGSDLEQSGHLAVTDLTEDE